jgi:hypothetical protein
MPRLVPVALLLLLLTSCTQNPGGAFSQSSSPTPSGTAPQPQLDTAALTALRDRAAAALLAHLPGGSLDLSWGAGSAVPADGPYADAAPEADAAGLQALKSLTRSPAPGVGDVTPLLAGAASATTAAFKQLEGPRGGAYLLLADAAHPPDSAAPSALDPSPAACPTPTAGRVNPDCLRRQVSDGLLAAWYATDTRNFFQVGETSTVYRPVDALAVGSALVVAGFQLHQESKIQAGAMILQNEMKSDVDSHFGLLYGLITATAQGGRSVTDYRAHLADQAGAAEALLEAFDSSREQQYMADARQLLQPLMDEAVTLRAASGGYVEGFDLQSAGPPDHTPADVLATVLVLQAAHHYDHDDGGHFTHLEETAAATLTAALDTDRKQGGAAAEGLPARVPGQGPASRSGLTTALAVTVLGDVLQGG